MLTSQDKSLIERYAREYKEAAIRHYANAMIVPAPVKDEQVRKLILSLSEQTQSASELAACKAWLEGRS